MPRTHWWRPIAVLALTLPLATMAVPAGASSPSLATVLSRAKASMLKAGRVHIAVRVTGTTPSTVTADIGRTSGREAYTAGTATVTVLVTPTSAYLRGNAVGLTKLVGLTTSQQRKVGKRYLKMGKGTSQYTTFSSNLTVAALAGLLPSNKNVKMSRNRRGEYLLTWTTAKSSTTAASTTTLTLSKGSRILPLSEDVRSASGGGTTTFSHWGQRFVVSAPPSSDTVAYSAVMTG